MYGIEYNKDIYEKIRIDFKLNEACDVALQSGPSTFQVTDTFENHIKMVFPIIPKMYICAQFFILFQGFMGTLTLI